MVLLRLWRAGTGTRLHDADGGKIFAWYEGHPDWELDLPSHWILLSTARAAPAYPGVN